MIADYDKATHSAVGLGKEDDIGSIYLKRIILHDLDTRQAGMAEKADWDKRRVSIFPNKDGATAIGAALDHIIKNSFGANNFVLWLPEDSIEDLNTAIEDRKNLPGSDPRSRQPVYVKPLD